MRDRTSIQRKVARFVLLVSVALAPAGGGCGGGSGTSSSSSSGSKGTLVVPFELGNNRSCEAVGVEYVVAELGDEEYVVEAECSYGQVRFLNIPAGRYRIKISGYDADDVAVMDNFETGDSQVEVLGDDMTTEHPQAITLTAAPARLLVRWTFGFSSCRGAGIDHFDIKVWREGDDLVLSDSLPCTLEGDGRDQYREIPDPERRFSGEQDGEVTVQPVDKTDVDVGPVAVFQYRKPGAGHEIRVSVECDQGACVGSGRVDRVDD